jgi:hypothetical protein
MAQEPTGTHAAYSLALPGPLFGTLPGSVTDLGQLANALAANSRLQGVDVQFPEDPTDDDIERAVQQLGGSWQVARYGVTR